MNPVYQEVLCTFCYECVANNNIEKHKKDCKSKPKDSYVVETGSELKKQYFASDTEMTL